MIHETAIVEDCLHYIEPSAKIWHYAHIREGASIGENCVVGRNVFVDLNVQIGDNCKIQNNSNLYQGSILGDGVFIGPGVILANDRYPSAINEDGSLKTDKDWKCEGVTIMDGASLGAGVIVCPGVTIGKNARVAAGTVVTRNIGDYQPYWVKGVPGK